LSQPISGSTLAFKLQNNYLKFEPPGLFDFLKWRWNALVDGHPKPVQSPTPKVEVDLGFIHANGETRDLMQPAITWIVHATALVKIQRPAIALYLIR
jgi:N-acyl-phosphatidylethanolamine-hydrolysing phospholipase D